MHPRSRLLPVLNHFDQSEKSISGSDQSQGSSDSAHVSRYSSARAHFHWAPCQLWLMPGPEQPEQPKQCPVLSNFFTQSQICPDLYSLTYTLASFLVLSERVSFYRQKVPFNQENLSRCHVGWINFLWSNTIWFTKFILGKECWVWYWQSLDTGVTAFN